MKPIHQLMLIGAMLSVSACASHDPYFKTGYAEYPDHKIEVVEDTIVLEVEMSEMSNGISYYDQRRVQSFIADYKDRGYRHGPLVLSLPMNSPWQNQLVTTANQTLDMAQDYGVRDVKRSDYESNGSPEAPLVLAFTAYRAIPPNCPSLASIDLTGSKTNDPQPRFGCAQKANLAMMVADPADLIGARVSDPADMIRRADVLDKYRSGQSTASERAESESGAISEAVN